MKFSITKSLIVVSLTLVALFVSCKRDNHSRSSKSLSSEMFADSIIKELDLNQKISLLHGMGAGNSEFGDLDVRYFGINGIKEKGIPPFYMGHGITGVRTGRDTTVHATYLTSPIAMGCSWDTNLYKDIAKAIAKELRATGNDLTLGPTLNIIRHPLGGRNWESLSEDPYLTAEMAVAYTKSIQANGIVCGPKHFVANNQENNRFDINNEVDERTLREIYLPAFKAAVVEGGALNIMGAYNRLNGDYMCHNEYLLDTILRKEWGFKGFVLSDFSNGVRDTKKAIDARMNVEMHRPKFYGDSLINLVKTNVIPEKRIDTLLKDVLKVMHRFNIFERERFEKVGSIHSPEHIKLAHQVAQQTPVLLKNNKAILPLATNNIKSIAVVGPNAKRFATVTEKHRDYSYYLQGGGSGRTYYFHNTIVEPYAGLVNTLGAKTTMSYAQGCKTPDEFAKNKVSILDDNEKQLIAKAVSVAKDAETAIIYAGLSGFNETEGWDRISAKLPGQQEKLIKEVAKVNPNTIVVLIAGSYIDVSSWIDDVEALLFVPYCGEQIGNGIAEILTGKVSPSGKLPFSWPKQVDHYPKGSIFKGNGYVEEGISNVYSEGVFVGYRWFDKENIDVQYPFGYGLSYTDFEYSNLNVDATTFPVKVSFNIKNTGQISGLEVAQLYIARQNPKIDKPKKELKAFNKLKLKKGESTSIEIFLDKEDFAYYDTKHKSRVIEGGNYEILVGEHSRNTLLKEKIILNDEILNTK